MIILSMIWSKSIMNYIAEDKYMSDMRTVYMDHAATTPVRQEVMEAMIPYFTETFGNTHSVHKWGRDSRGAVEKARQQVADAINADPSEIFFTGGATEADNWSVRGFAMQNKKKETILLHPA